MPSCKKRPTPDLDLKCGGCGRPESTCAKNPCDARRAYEEQA